MKTYQAIGLALAGVMVMPSSVLANEGYRLGDYNAVAMVFNDRAPISSPIASRDNKPYAEFGIDQLELVSDRDEFNWRGEWQYSYGSDANRVVAGQRAMHEVARDFRFENVLFFSHDTDYGFKANTGVRHDSGVGVNRDWVGVGAEIEAPCMAIVATVYAGDAGRTLFALEFNHERVIAAKWMIEGRLESNFLDENDVDLGVGRGLSDVGASVRLHREFSREFSPYVGVSWARVFGETAAIAKADQSRIERVEFMLGLRAWF